MEKKIFLTACLILTLYFSAAAQSAFDEKLQSLYRNTVPLITAEVLEKKLVQSNSIILLDIRSVTEYNVSHIPKAILIDYRNFETDELDTLPRHTKIVVYCSVGYRSERVGEKLLAMGFKDVMNLYGGIFEWVNKGYTIVDLSNIATNRVHTYNRSWSKWLEKGEKIY